MQTQSIDRSQIWRVIAASSVGTVIEWYDFYIFGSLAMIIAPLFYPSGNDSLAFIANLSTFTVSFIVRPFGALFLAALAIASDASMRFASRLSSRLSSWARRRWSRPCGDCMVRRIKARLRASRARRNWNGFNFVDPGLVWTV